jgi:hypothetical protein
MLDIAVAEVSLKRPCVVAFIGERVAAGVPEHVRMDLESKPRRRARRSTMRASPAVVKGAARSEVNTKADLGSCSRWRRRRARSSPQGLGGYLGCRA